MKLGIRRGLFLGLAALGMVAGAAAPAGATVPVNVGVLVVPTGAGTIAPGLQALPVGQQNFTFSAFQVTGVGFANKSPVIPVVNTSTCGANGRDGIILPTDPGKTRNGWPGDSILVGTGLGFWACANGPLAGKSGLLYYTRVGPVVLATFTDNTPAPVLKLTPIAALACVFVPGQLTPPVTSFSLTCAGAAADVK